MYTGYKEGDGEESTSVDESTEVSSSSAYSGAYLTPRKKADTKVAPKEDDSGSQLLPPKAKPAPELLMPEIIEEESKEDETIEVIECPGIDGAKEQKGFPMRAHPLFQRSQK